LLGDVRVLHRIFHGDDVAVRSAVAVIHHRGQRGALARARAAHQQHQPALLHHDILEDGRQAEPVDGGDLGRDGAHHHGHMALLHEHVDAEPAHPGQSEGEIALHVALELLALTLVHQRPRELGGHLAAELLLRQRPHPAVRLHRGGVVVRDEKIRTPGLRHRRQQLVHVAARLIFRERGHVVSILGGGVAWILVRSVATGARCEQPWFAQFPTGSTSSSNASKVWRVAAVGARRPSLPFSEVSLIPNRALWPSQAQWRADGSRSHRARSEMSAIVQPDGSCCALSQSRAKLSI
jgi:hypothetical protein